MNQPKFLPLHPIEEAQLSLHNIATELDRKTQMMGITAKDEIDRVMAKLEQELKPQAY
jgi:hypothetical protein